MLQLNKLNNYIYYLSPFIVFIAVSIPLISVFYLYDLNKGFESSNYIFSITFFSFYQSLLSAILSIIIGAVFAYLLISIFNQNFLLIVLLLIGYVLYKRFEKGGIIKK